MKNVTMVSYNDTVDQVFYNGWNTKAHKIYAATFYLSSSFHKKGIGYETQL